MRSEVATFVDLLWGSVTRSLGYLTLWHKDAKQRGGTSLHVELQNQQLVQGAAESWTEQGIDTYFGVGLRDANLGHYRQGKASQIAALPGLFIDVDLAAPGGVHAADREKSAKKLPATLDDAERILSIAPTLPTAVVHTGYGVHAYWLFPEPFVIQSESHRERARWILKAFQKKLIEAAARDGLHVDDTATLTRVLRLPGTKNFKRASDPRDVVLLLTDGPRSSMEAFEQACWKGQRGKHVTEAAVWKPGTASEVPIADAEWLGEVRTRLGRLHDAGRQQVLAKVLRGESFAEPGERDEKLMMVCSVIAFVAARYRPDAEAEQLAEILRASLACWAAEEGAQLSIDEELAKAIDKLSRALADARRKLGEQAAAEERIAAALERKGRSGGDGEGQGQGQAGAQGEGDSSDGGSSGLASGSTGNGTSAGGANGSPRTAEERRQLLRQVVIQHRTSFYLYDDTKDVYLPPVTKEELEVALRDPYENASFIEWWYEDAKGVLRRKDSKRFLQDYCTVANAVRFDMTGDSRYCPEEGCFYEAVCRRRDLEPRFDPDIDQWLRLIGMADVERFFDWIATVTWLKWPTAALYLSGRSSAGKGLFVDGLARLWTTGKRTDFAQAFGNFNADILGCPLVVADEGLKYSGASAAVRRFVGSANVTVTRKYMPTATLIGCPRLVILANNDRALEFKDEDNDLEDVGALAIRFLHLRVAPCATDYLRALGGRPVTERWVEDDLIAKHALFIEKERQVSLGGDSRLLVEGHATKMHRELVMQSHANSLCLEWLAKFLDSPDPGPVQKELIFVGKGKIAIMASAISEFWDGYVKSHNVFSLKRIGSALKGISLGNTHHKGRDYWLVDPSLIYEWAEACKFGSVEEMRWLVDSPALYQQNDIAEFKRKKAERAKGRSDAWT